MTSSPPPASSVTFASDTFAEKVVVVTGASQGIGAAIALAFAQAGASVVAGCPAHDAEQHRDAVAAWRNAAGLPAEQVAPMTADVSRVEEVHAFYETVRKHFGHVHVLVNNAGINRDHTLAKMTDEEWRAVLAVNLDGTFFNCRAVLPLLQDQGRIINISSMVAQTGNFGVANYAASKAGILGLTKSLALELAPRGITVNAVCPGFIDTDMTRGMPDDVLTAYIDRIPLGRAGHPEDVASTVLFLASPGAGYLTGQSLGVNGGLYTGD